jgi:aminoglycoside phosphotransferase (APT) family kinase protein
MLLDRNDIPAPSLILGQETARILGRPAIVMSLVDGKPNVNPSDREDWVRQLVEAIGRVHATPVPSGILKLIPSAYARYDRWFSQTEPPEFIARHPLGLRLWRTLKDLWPGVDKSARQRIHADYWSGNTLWKDEDLVAIIDWEQPRIGEPTFDVADLVQDAACFGIDIEQRGIRQYERSSSRPPRDYGFWRMAVAMGEMGDMSNPVDWAEGFAEMGGRRITPAEVSAYHAASIEQMLADA